MPINELYAQETLLRPNEIKDSGDRTTFASGAVRDMQKGKGRCDLMPLDVVAKCYQFAFPDDHDIVSTLSCIQDFIDTGDEFHLVVALYYFGGFDDSWATLFLETAQHFEAGAEKYGENNWQKGLPVWCYINSAVRHYLKWIRNDEDEPHDRAFCWNILCAIWTCIHKPELNEYARKAEKND